MAARALVGRCESSRMPRASSSRRYAGQRGLRSSTTASVRGDSQRVLERARATRGVALMGVCNVTPDSFSDGGRHFAPERRARAGGRARSPRGPTSSTSAASRRARAPTPVPRGEQLGARARRRALRGGRGACVSIDTTSPEVAAACLDAGRLRGQRRLVPARRRRSPRVAAARGAALVLMHARGHAGRDARASASTPTTPTATSSRDVRRASGSAAAERALAAGRRRATRSSWTPGSASRRTRGRASSSSRARRELVARVGVPVARRREPQVVPDAVVDRDAPPDASASAPRIAAALHAGARGRRHPPRARRARHPPGHRPRAPAARRRQRRRAEGGP